MKEITIMIVDDDPLTRESLRLLLEHQGYRILEASNAIGVISQADGQFINVVLLDLHLAHESGLDILRQIKQMSEDTQVIMITGFGTLASAREAMDWAAFAYVEKPIDMASLLTTVERAIDKQHFELSTRKPLSYRLSLTS